MTEGGYRRRGVLFAPSEALEEEPVVFRYARSYLDRTEVLRENRKYSLGNLTFSTAQRHFHSVETYGFNFHLPRCTLSYITDTKYDPDLIAQYPGDILLLNVVLLADMPEREIEHFSIDDVRRILKGTKAKVVILTHFGRRILEAKPRELTERLREETGVKIIAARDGMTLKIDEVLKEG